MSQLDENTVLTGEETCQFHVSYCPIHLYRFRERERIAYTGRMDERLQKEIIAKDAAIIRKYRVNTYSFSRIVVLDPFPHCRFR